MSKHSSQHAIASLTRSLAVALTLVPSIAWSAGFEKTVMWSGKHAGRVNAAVGDVSGAESLYFNPAGLAKQAESGEVSLNFSPTLSKFEGAVPFQNGIQSIDGSTTFSPVFGGLANFKVTDKLGIGAGVFVSGGTKARFKDIDYSTVSGGAPYTLKPTVETNLSVTELSLGAGYEVLPRLRLGFAWRYLMVDADFSTVAAPTGNPALAISNVSADGLEAKRWNAFRAGIQYTSEENNWGAGATFRSSVKFTAKGTTSGFADTAAATAPAAVVGGPIHVTNTFPLQINVGGFYKVTDAVRIFPEYSYTNYSENDVLDLSGSVNGIALADIRQNWKNQHIGRLGAEYAMSDDTALRVGYALTSQVTPDNRARSTFASPGTGHTITIGAGHQYLNDMLEVDVAFEHAFASGKGTNPDESITTEKDFSSKAYVLHTGLTYRF